MAAHSARGNERELARRLLIALLTPVGLLVATGGLMAWQISRLMSEQAWASHSRDVLARTHDAHRRIVEQESALRGYLLSGDKAFLGTYEAVHPDTALSDLRQLVADNPAQVSRANTALARYQDWHELAAQAASASGADLTPYRSAASIGMRAQRMDVAQSAMEGFLDAELDLERERSNELETSYRITRSGGLVLFIGLTLSLALLSRRQLGAVADTYSAALGSEKEARETSETQDWIQSGLVELAESVQGNLSVEEVASRALTSVSARVDAASGLLFVDEDDRWIPRAGHGALPRKKLEFARSEGLVGRAAVEAKLLQVAGVPDHYLKVKSGLGRTGEVQLVFVPAVIENEVNAVIELAFLHEPTLRAIAFLSRAGEILGAAIRGAHYRSKLKELLVQAQHQTEQLETQQEELRVTNEELEEQSHALQRAQAELEERQQALEEVNASLEAQTGELKRAERELTAKASDVERVSRYKSEFLANMSHELRTPLNSTLILAKLLADNEPNTLNAEQVKFADTIYNAGTDLLDLINDILDLSKIEAGRMDVNATVASIEALVEPMRRSFEPAAKHKGLRFHTKLHVPPGTAFSTDVQKVQQILRNLLSNAIKFTERGEVVLTVVPHETTLEFVVHDTGIGMQSDQLEVIFEAFRQADGTTSRKYGGTGLGLSISRDLARLLGGDLSVQSEVGRGSTFTLFVPRALTSTPARGASSRTISDAPRAPSSVPAPLPRGVVPDDRDSLDPDKHLLLVVEDDLPFADILLSLGHEMGFQVAVATSAGEGLELAEALTPLAILLDVRLPDRSGLSLLDNLKRRAATRHIPVHVVSVDDYTQQALSLGAVGYLTKPVSREKLAEAIRRLEGLASERVRHVLVVEDDANQREAISRLLAGHSVEVVAVANAKDALVELGNTTFDCVVTHLGLPDQMGEELLATMAADERLSFPPIIVYTGRELGQEEEERLRRYSSSIIVKGARSPERLLDEVTLFLHQVEAKLPAERQRMLRKARDREAEFQGRCVLVVEDDVRNVFALTSVLEPRGLQVSVARNGKEALARLETGPVDLVLMDIMMPEMDGLEATRAIRSQKRFQKLPIIALTAKAMSDDRQNCLDAGANDYIPKPLDVDRLMSLLRVWLPPRG